MNPRIRPFGPLGLFRPLFPAALAALLALAAACTTERRGPELGLLKFSIEVLKSGPNGQPATGIPGTTVAFCLAPVRLPEGPRKITAVNNGMMVEAGWDEIVSLAKDSRGVTKVRIRNLRWSLLNPVRYNTRVQNLLPPPPVPSLNVGRTLEPLQPPVKMVSGMSDPEWQKNMWWVFGASWTSGAEDRAPEIDVVKGYQKAHPEMARPPVLRPLPPRRSPVRK